MTPARSLRTVPDAVRLVELGVRSPAGRCGAITYRADRCRMPGEAWTGPLWLCRSHRCRAVEGVALHVIGADGWLWRIG